MQFLSQAWTLTKKDLVLIGRRNWFSTALRAFIFPIVITTIISCVKIFTSSGAHYGLGGPTPLLPLADALQIGDARDRFVIIDHNLVGDDVQFVVSELSKTVRNGNKELHMLSNLGELSTICPSSSRGVSRCFAAVEFIDSPNSRENGTWTWTLRQDGSIGSHVNVNSNRNDVEVYTLPLQHTIDDLIASTNGGTGIDKAVQQYPFTYITTAQLKETNQYNFQSLVSSVLAFAFFAATCGITYHLTGHITNQRERGMLQLIDAMMPNQRRWECLTARTISVHLAFVIIYGPASIIMGAIVGTIVFPNTATGWIVLLYWLTGLALTSYSILASSLFRREQLSAISTTIAAVVFAIVAQFGEYNSAAASTAGAIATAVLFPPSAFVYFIIDCAEFEQSGLGLEINGGSHLGLSWNISASVFLGCLAFQTIAYPVIGALIEKALHGNSSRSRHMQTSHAMNGNAVRLSAFSKRYKGSVKKRDRVQAVQDLTLDFRAGSLTVLLGANGSGKSTTLNAIAGLESISGGQIEIDGTGGIGFCPQRNVHWDKMTVNEHVSFFERLKRPAWSQAQRADEVNRIVAACDLEIKKTSRAKTLSGGQMRKLQLAMMLAGGSRVCCIDEASSGIDPLARRKVWDVLLKERGARTMLLTTHFLDETDVLADYVAILSKGELRAQGTAASLKSRLGGGYDVVLPGHASASLPHRLPSQVVCRRDYNDAVFKVPDASTLSALIARLGDEGISNYRIHGPTIEEVFLRHADEMQAGEKRAYEPDSGTGRLRTPAESDHQSGAAVLLKGMTLNTGKGCGPMKQIAILFLKRLTVLKHNFMPYVAALFVPLVCAGMVTRFKDRDYPDGLPCSKPGGVQSSLTSYGYGSVSLNAIAGATIFGPPEEVTVSLLEDLLPSTTDGYYAQSSSPVKELRKDAVNSLEEFNSKIENSIGGYDYIVGGFFIGDSVATIAYQGINYGGPYAATQMQAVMDNALLNQSLVFTLEPFAEPWTPDDFYQGILAIFAALGFAVYPGFFALYPTAERLRKVRAMQYSNGILSSSLWIAYALFDFMFVLLVSLLVTVIWAVLYAGWYGLGYIFLILVLYGIAATAYSYIISLLVPSQLAAIAATSLVQVTITMLYFLGHPITINNAMPTEIYSTFNIIYYTVALVCPAVSLLRSLMVGLNVYSLACDGSSKAAYPGTFGLYGGPILCLIIQIVVFVAFLMFWESGRSLEVFGIRSKKRKAERATTSSMNGANQDAAEDEKHLAEANDGLRVHHISKTFGANRAVDDVSFGILPSEKLALLGPNGAGKSTMISLIRGEIHADSTQPPGSIYIASDSLTHAPVAAKDHLGVCPQFDAVDSMTLSENLHFYARARGVPDKDTNINELISQLGLTEHRNKLTKKLSGGTKRKLSLAIALVANPSVLLLDEPSSGMDAAAKRALWRTLSMISAQRCLLLTTHSMEEADALCDRACILSSKVLALDTIPQLCAQHGDKIYVHFVHTAAPYSSASAIEAVWQWVNSTFVVAEAEQRTYGGQVRFAIPARQDSSQSQGLVDGSDMGRLFRLIEQHKAAVGIEDYSISPAMLDQVFMNVVSKHNVVEENTQRNEKSKSLISRLLRTWRK